MAIDDITGPEDALFYVGPCIGGCKRLAFKMNRGAITKIKILAPKRLLETLGFVEGSC